MKPSKLFAGRRRSQGSAHSAGLRKNDRILTVNGVDVQGKTHQFVVEQVLKGGAHPRREKFGFSNQRAGN